MIVSVIVLALVTIDMYISKQAESDLYQSSIKIPEKKAALVLGTAKYMVGGGKNYFYTYRIRAAAELYKAGKVKAIVVSGDNSTKYYNETSKMQKDLIKAGIPSRYITLDPLGVRTLDSVVRAEAIFDLKDYIIVSQKFHLERALFIAKAKGQKVIGFMAKDIPGTKAAYRMKAREYLARAKAFLDVYILQTTPKFDGKKEKVNYKK
jgi:SanA protein